MMPTNTQVKLARRPVGLPKESDWTIEKHPIPTIDEGEVLICNEYISLDPAMRGWMNDVPSYVPPVQIGEVMRANTIGKVVASKNEGFPVGTVVLGVNGVQVYATSNGKGLYRVDHPDRPLPVYLGTLGMPGYTAYFGLLDVGQPKEGDTVLVSGGAGAVGSVVGQIAKIKGCRAVGIAGGAKKCRYITEELGFDAAIDYKNEDVYEGIKRHCPKGVDVYFDNVGGDILDMALRRINLRARIVICGAISQYNATAPVKGPANYLALLVKRARMEGMLVMDYASEYGKAAVEMNQWMTEGKLKSKEYVIEGIELFNEAFLRLFSGQKMGKLVLKV